MATARRSSRRRRAVFAILYFMRIRLILLMMFWLTAGLVRHAPTDAAAQPLDRPLVQVRPPDLLPTDVIQHIRTIYARGQVLRNRPNVFSKIGDSITVSDNFLHPIGYGVYDLDAYGYLYDLIEYFSEVEVGEGRNSFNAVSLAAGVGWSAWSAFQLENADVDLCLPEETPIICEIRNNRPSMAVIMFGTNEVSYMDASVYRNFIARIIDVCEAYGVIPIISTLPDRHAHEAQIAVYNEQLRALAAARQVPLVDFAAALRNVPDRGVGRDGVHPSYPPDRWFDGAALFTPDYLGYGYNLRNLTTLQTLDRVWRSLGAAT